MSRATAGRSSLARLGAAAAAVSCLAVVAACSTPADQEKEEATAPVNTDNPDVAAAQAVLKRANEELVMGPAEGPVTPDDLRAISEDDFDVHPWSGDAEGKKIFIASGSSTVPAIVHQVNLATAWFEALGFEVKSAAGNFTPAEDQRVMNEALKWDPDAIYDVSVLPAAIGPQLAEAKERGIPVVYTVGTPNNTPGEFAGWVSQSTNLSQALFAAQLIVQSGGDANVMWVKAPLFKEIETDVGMQYMEENCADCTMDSFEAVDQLYTPVAMASMTTSLLRADPDLDYLALPAACVPVAAAVEAARQLGDVDVEATGCPASAAALINTGDLYGATGIVEPMSVLQGMDQLLRMLDGEEPLPADQTGPAAFYFDAETIPDPTLDGNFGPIDRWALSKFDFLAPYEEEWDVDLHSAIEDED